jgi:hypothetical protein
MDICTLCYYRNDECYISRCDLSCTIQGLSEHIILTIAKLNVTLLGVRCHCFLTAEKKECYKSEVNKHSLPDIETMNVTIPEVKNIYFLTK